MLAFLNALARRIRPLRWLFWLILVIGVGGFIGTVTGLLALSDAYAVLFLVCTMWALTLLVVVGCFPRNIAPADPDADAVAWVSNRVNNAFTWLIGAATVLASGAVVITTLKLVGIFASHFTN